MMKKIINLVLVVLMMVGSLSLAGCASTWDGVGKDIEQIGKDIQS